MDYSCRRPGASFEATSLVVPFGFEWTQARHSKTAMLYQAETDFESIWEFF